MIDMIRLIETDGLRNNLVGVVGGGGDSEPGTTKVMSHQR